MSNDTMSDVSAASATPAYVTETSTSTSTSTSASPSVDVPPPPSAISSSPDLASLNILRQGAEGRIYLTSNKYSSQCIIKERFAKMYRHPTLDYKLTKHRIKSEARCLAKVQAAGVHTPNVYHTDIPKRESKNPRDHPYRGMRIYMEYVDGITVKEWLWTKNLKDPKDSEEAEALALRIGKAIAIMHQAGVIHGDLTTSNMMLGSKPVTSTSAFNNNTSTPTSTSTSTSSHSATSASTSISSSDSTSTLASTSTSTSTSASTSHEQKEINLSSASTIPTSERPLYLIDFGLASVSGMIEDKAVDLYVLERALLSTHHDSEHLFQRMVQAYADHKTHRDASKVLSKLQAVRARGRKRTMIG